MKPYRKKKSQKISLDKRALPSAYFSPTLPLKLEKGICYEPKEITYWKQLRSWLQRHGDPRGELAQLFEQQETQFLTTLKKYAPYFTGKIEPVLHQIKTTHYQEHFLLREQLTSDMPIVFEWYYGYIYSARLGFNPKLFLQQRWKQECGPNLLLEEFLRLDSARFTRFLTLGCFHFGGENNYVTELQQLAQSSRLKCLEGLYLGDFLLEENPLSWSESGDVSLLSGQYPQLKTLLIRAGEMTFTKIQFPQLQKLVLITNGLTQKGLKGLQNSVFSKLKHLEIYIGAKEYGKNCSVSDFHFLFFGNKQFPALKYLGIKNAENQGEFLSQILQSPILRQLEVLDCSMGTLGDEELLCLFLNATKLAHLKYIDLRYNSLKNVQILSRKLPCQVLTEPQNRIDDAEDRCIYLGE